MRVFSTLSLVAAAIVSLIPSTLAAPVVDANASAVVAARANSPPVGPAVGDAASTNIYARLLGCDSIVNGFAGTPSRGDDKCATILVDLQVNLNVQIGRLNDLTRETATKDNIQLILSSIVSSIVDATVQINALVGTGITCNARVCASLLGGILTALTSALAFVLTLVADSKVLLDIIASVALGNCLCGLISAVLAIVDGLLVSLIPLVLFLTGTLVSLGLNVVGQLLTIC